jgi:hypothetical protein
MVNFCYLRMTGDVAGLPTICLIAAFQESQESVSLLFGSLSHPKSCPASGRLAVLRVGGRMPLAQIMLAIDAVCGHLRHASRIKNNWAEVKPFGVQVRSVKQVPNNKPERQP